MSNDRPAASLPKYLQLSETLIRDIASGRLVDGARLPPERDMAQAMNVSVGTLRKALSAIEELGVLERIHGSGNYIRAKTGVPSVYSLLRIELVEGGGLPTARLLSVDRLPKPEAAPGFGPSATGWRFRRLRYLGDIPAALEEIWLDSSFAEQIDPAEVSESLYLFYRETLGLAILSAEDRITVAQVPDWSDARFEVLPGQVAGYIERISRDGTGAAVEFSRTWFDPDRVRYVSRLGQA